MFAVTLEDRSLSLALSGRDPLGIMPIWQHRARDIVPFLTAASRLAEGFHILLIGLAWWPVFATIHKRPKQDIVKFFLLLEQAFARATRCNGEFEWKLPGAKRLYSGESGVWIGLRSEHFLLDNQQTNGVWGLYRGPALNAKLIDASNQICNPTLESEIKAKTRFIEALFTSINSAITSSPLQVAEIAKYRTKFIVGALSNLISELPFKRTIRDNFVSPTQPEITRLLAALALEQKADSEIASFIDLAIDRYPAHSSVLRNILRCEHYLAPLEAIFEYICSYHGRYLTEAANSIPIDLAEIMKARDDFQRDDYQRPLPNQGLSKIRSDLLLKFRLDSSRTLIESVLNHHLEISKARRNAPWVCVGESGRLDCRLSVRTPPEEQLSPWTAWRNSYYIDTLRGLSRQISPVRSK